VVLAETATKNSQQTKTNEQNNRVLNLNDKQPARLPGGLFVKL